MMSGDVERPLLAIDDANDDDEGGGSHWENFVERPEQRQVNYGRLCTLVIREGTDRIRHYTKTNLNQSVDIAHILRLPRVQAIFLELKKSRKIPPHQYKALYPEDGGEIDEENLDMSVWVIIARNLCVDHDLINWDKTPGDDDDLLPHHILRIRDARNKLSHLPRNELPFQQFRQMWSGLVPSLRKLGSKEQEIARLRTQDLDPETTRLCIAEVKNQALEEQCGKLESQVRQRQLLLFGFIALFIILVVSFTALLITSWTYSKTQLCSDSLLSVRTKDAMMQFMPRSGWSAKTPDRNNLLRFHGPVDLLIVSQTAMNGNCLEHEDCCRRVFEMQQINMEKPQRFADIAFSYLIGGDGVAYEGRGQFYIPATVPGLNLKSLSMGYVGLFTQSAATDAAIEAGPIFIQYLVDTGALSHNTTVLGMCQVYGSKYPRSPGIYIMKEMQKWNGNGWKWRPTNVTDCEGMSDFTVDQQ